MGLGRVRTPLREGVRPSSIDCTVGAGNRRLPAEAEGCRLHGRFASAKCRPTQGRNELCAVLQRFSLLAACLALCLSGLALWPRTGTEIDLTGTWEGAQICDDLIGGEFGDFVVVDNPLLVVQDGDRFRFVYVGDEEELADDLVYEGVIQNVEGSDQFEAMAGICGGDYKAEEIVRLRRIEISETAARFDANLSSSPTTFRRSRGFSTSRPASGRTSGCRRSGPTCRSASDQGFARRNHEGDGQLIPTWCSSPGPWCFNAPRPRLASAGVRASRRSR